MLAEGFLSYTLDILAVNQNSSVISLIETGNKSTKSGFTAARGANESYALTRLDVKVELAKNVFLRSCVAECEVLKCDFASYVFNIFRVFRVLNVGIDVHNLAKALNTRHTALELLGELHKTAN